MKYSLKELNSFGVESYSSKLFLINSINDFYTIDYNIRQQEKIILGGGTNILLKSKFISIPIFKIQIQGIEICHEKDDEVLISVGAGVNWDEFVWWCVNKNFGGIENLV